VAFAQHLVRDIGVATVPGSSFFRDKELGRQYIRFCFCKQDSTLGEAIQRLKRLRVIAY
jgi:aminotransferase